MRVNSDEAIARAIRYREEQGNKSWLELTRDPEMQRHSREFFNRGLQGSSEQMIDQAR
jgi:hypothetical protein